MAIHIYQEQILLYKDMYKEFKHLQELVFLKEYNFVETSISLVKINGEPINDIRYADDMIIICDSLEDLPQLLVLNVKPIGEPMGLKINISRTKFMIFSCQLLTNLGLSL